MNNTQHTPGPTCTCGVITTVIETGIGCYDENEIAQCPLCKAAPAMYEALKLCKAFIDHGPSATRSAARCKEVYDNALAQAEGKP